MIDKTLRIQFESYLRQLATSMRSQFAEHDASHLHFTVEVSGRPDGDLKIEFRLSDEYYGSSPVKAGDLSDLMEEFFRRKHWERRNAPLMISQHGEEEREAG